MTSCSLDNSEDPGTEPTDEYVITTFNPYADFFFGLAYTGFDNTDEVSGKIEMDGKVSELTIIDRLPTHFNIHSLGREFAINTTTYDAEIIVTKKDGTVITFSLEVVSGKLEKSSLVSVTHNELHPELALGAQVGSYLVGSTVAVDESEYTVTNAELDGAQFSFTISVSNELSSKLYGSAQFDYSELKYNGGSFVSQPEPLNWSKEETTVKLNCRKIDANFNGVTGTGKVVWETGYVFSFTVGNHIDANAEEKIAENFEYTYAFSRAATSTAVRFIAKISNVEETDLANYSDVVITVKVGEVVKSYGATCVYKTVNSVNGIAAISEEAYYSVITFTNVPDGTVFTVSAVAHGVEGTDDISTAENTFTLSGNAIA